MTESYFAGVYWLGRGESADACARRASKCLQALSNLDPMWVRWCEGADSFEEASRRQVSTDPDSLTEYFLRPERRFEDAFTYWLWSGSQDEGVRVDGICGSEDLWTPSSSVLTPPPSGPMADRILSPEMRSEILRRMVVAWEPEFGLMTSSDHLISLSSRPKAGSFVSWMTYFSRQRGPVPPLPEPVRVEPVGDLGTLVTLTQERFTVSNPQHVRLAAEVQRVLEGAGLMHPLRPRT
jgi:hypothetical protein